MNFTEQEDGELGAGGGCCTRSREAVDKGRVKMLPRLEERACAQLVGASGGFQFLARNPCFQPQKIQGGLSKPGCCSPALANSRFFQRLVFSETKNVFG